MSTPEIRAPITIDATNDSLTIDAGGGPVVVSVAVGVKAHLFDLLTELQVAAAAAIGGVVFTFGYSRTGANRGKVTLAADAAIALTDNGDDLLYVLGFQVAAYAANLSRTAEAENSYMFTPDGPALDTDSRMAQGSDWDQRDLEVEQTYSCEGVVQTTTAPSALFSRDISFTALTEADTHWIQRVVDTVKGGVFRYYQDYILVAGYDGISYRLGYFQAVFDEATLRKITFARDFPEVVDSNQVRLRCRRFVAP